MLVTSRTHPTNVRGNFRTIRVTDGPYFVAQLQTGLNEQNHISFDPSASYIDAARYDPFPRYIDLNPDDCERFHNIPCPLRTIQLITSIAQLQATDAPPTPLFLALAQLLHILRLAAEQRDLVSDYPFMGPSLAADDPTMGRSPLANQ